jgi:hypothetical protein
LRHSGDVRTRRPIPSASGLARRQRRLGDGAHRRRSATCSRATANTSTAPAPSRATEPYSSSTAATRPILSTSSRLALSRENLGARSRLGHDEIICELTDRRSARVSSAAVRWPRPARWPGSEGNAKKPDEELATRGATMSQLTSLIRTSSHLRRPTTGGCGRRGHGRIRGDSPRDAGRWALPTKGHPKQDQIHERFVLDLRTR